MPGRYHGKVIQLPLLLSACDSPWSNLRNSTMKYFVLAVAFIATVSAQYHGNGGYSSGGYGGQQSSGRSMSGGHRAGRSLIPQGYSAAGAGRVASGPSIASSGSYGQSGHRMGRSVSVLPVVSSYGRVGLSSGEYSQGGLHSGHRYARSVVAIAPMAGHGSYSGLASSAGYGSYAGHGHRMVRSPVGGYGGAAMGQSSSSMGVSQGGYSNGGYQRGGMGGGYSKAGYQQGGMGVHRG